MFYLLGLSKAYFISGLCISVYFDFVEVTFETETSGKKKLWTPFVSTNLSCGKQPPESPGMKKRASVGQNGLIFTNANTCRIYGLQLLT